MRSIFALLFAAAVFALPASADDVAITEKEYSFELAELAELEIVTTPGRAEIYIDGEYRGLSDAVLPLPKPGPHRLRLSRPGWKELSVDFTVKSGTGIKISADLAEETGILRITGLPPGTLVTGDGKPLGEGENILQPGSYTIVAEKDGRKILVETVRVYSGRETALEIGIEEPEETPGEEQTSGDGETVRVKAESGISVLPGETRHCPDAGTLPPGSFRITTGAGYDGTCFPIFAGAVFSFDGRLGIGAGLSLFASPAYISDSAAGAGVSVKYSLREGDPEGFNAAARLELRLTNAAEGSACRSYSGLSLLVPLKWSFKIEDISLSLSAAPGLSGGFTTADGVTRDYPVFTPLLPAALTLKTASFRAALSAAPVLSDIGPAFPGWEDISAAAEAGLRLGDASAFSLFFGITPSGFEGGAAVSFGG